MSTADHPAGLETFAVLGRSGLVDPAAVASFEVLSTPEVSDHRPLVLDLR